MKTVLRAASERDRQEEEGMVSARRDRRQPSVGPRKKVIYYLFFINRQHHKTPARIIPTNFQLDEK